MNQVQALNQFALQKTKYTPDIAGLEQTQFQLVFVCDDLMRAGDKYSIINDCSAFICRAFTYHRFNFYKKVTDGTAVLINPTGKMETGCLRVKGELYAVESYQLPKLDNHYQNGVQFKRYRRKLLYPTTPVAIAQDVDVDGKPLPQVLQGNGHKKVYHLPEQLRILEAWVYIGLRSYWDDLIDGGFAFEPVRIAEPKKERIWLHKYYHWQNKS